LGDELQLWEVKDCKMTCRCDWGKEFELVYAMFFFGGRGLVLHKNGLVQVVSLPPDKQVLASFQ
jgi:hypothetical protein